MTARPAVPWLSSGSACRSEPGASGVALALARHEEPRHNQRTPGLRVGVSLGGQLEVRLRARPHADARAQWDGIDGAGGTLTPYTTPKRGACRGRGGGEGRGAQPDANPNVFHLN